MVRLDVGTAWERGLQNNMGNNTDLGLEPRSWTLLPLCLATEPIVALCI